MKSKNSILIVLICFLCIFLSGCEKKEEDTITAMIENNGDTSCVSDSDLDHLICNEKSTFTIVILLLYSECGPASGFSAPHFIY